jgi:hypothetical protein
LDRFDLFQIKINGDVDRRRLRYKDLFVHER